MNNAPITKLEPVHFTHLKRMSDSPAHYQVAVEEGFPDTPQFLMGRLVHFLVLGGEYTYAVFEGTRRQGKVWDAFEEANRGRDIFKADELAHAQRIADAVKNDKVAAPFLEGLREQKIMWSFMGRACSSRVDVLNDFTVELKTTQSANPTKFRWDVDRYGYHAQLAFYQDAARSMGHPTKGGIIIAVEKEAPFAVTVCSLSNALLEEGRKLNVLWMERLKACEEANEWPTYVQHVVDYDVRQEEGVTLLIDGEEVAA